MTLIVAAGNSDYAVIAADSRISWNGKPVDDETAKVSHYTFCDGRLISGFTGLAFWRGFETKKWWLGRLYDIAQPWVTATESLGRLTHDLTKEFESNDKLKSLDQSSKRLSIVFGGFIDRLPFSALISNFEDHNGEFSDVRHEFVLTKCEARDQSGAWIGMFGARRYISDRDRDELYFMANDRSSVEAVKGKCLSMVLKAAQETRNGGVVGRNVLTATLLSEGHVCSWYSTENQEDKLISVDQYNSTAAAGFPMMIRDVSISASGITSPRSKRRGRGGKHQPPK
jgi:hypothetical protein